MADDLKEKKNQLETAYAALYASLDKKASFVKDRLQKCDVKDKAMWNRLNAEQDHVDKAADYITAVKEYIKALEEDNRSLRHNLNMQTRILNFFRKEGNEYMDQYYDLVCAITEGKVELEINALYELRRKEFKKENPG